MRVGRPIPALPKPDCDYCGMRARLVNPGDDGYPYAEDFGALWICSTCQAWIGVHGRSKHQTPLGRLANAALRDAKNRLHAALQPLVEAKMRRDGINVFEARGKALKWLITSMNLASAKVSVHALSLEQCEQAIHYIEAFQAARRKKTSTEGASS
ncbi:zinc-finger-containing protein [Cupriavidus necator]